MAINTTRGYALLPLAPIPILGGQVGLLILLRAFPLDALSGLAVVGTNPGFILAALTTAVIAWFAGRWAAGWALAPAATARSLVLPLLGTLVVTALIALIPYEKPELIAGALVWLVLMVAGLAGAAQLSAAGHPRWAGLAGGAAAFVALELSVIVAVLLRFTPTPEEPLSLAGAPLWYPSSLGLDLPLGSMWFVGDLVDLLPIALTAPSVFVVAFVLAGSRRPS
ncbi:hypothetical protein F4553_002040 [Allocatelliglobosispora scoriae]|uniref:Uncharacterized protein n=1 Tax=Allocatelliglobosispora scoriae TaxID=643052 RepID=A0A841BPA8_9ACTN|nr:hypothetical protein [Allocatelliglobosispora scoriae]MBB5868661.1 hypothetical protein [Allocatelliglobosispora scoriae]